MNGPSILQFLDRVTDTVKAASPIATMLGIPFAEKFAGWADTAVEIAQNAVTRAEDTKIVLSSNDKDEINRKIAHIQEINNQIMDYVKNS